MSQSRKPQTEFAYRSQSSLNVSSGPPQLTEGFAYSSSNSTTRLFQYNSDGSYFAYVTNDCVQILETNSYEVKCEIARPNVIDIAFSPRGKFLCTWERPTKAENGSFLQNLHLWDTSSGQLLFSWFHKSQNNWFLQFSSDEIYCGRLASNEVQIYLTKNFDKGVYYRLKLETISGFSISPGKSPTVSVFIPEKKGAPASLRLYSISNFNVPIASKSFYRADSVRFLWNKLGTGVLALTQTDEDHSGKSYYGETNLYYLSVAGNYDCKVPLDKEGPVHDVTWNPNSKEFAVVYGFMPPKATLFDHRASVLHEFGSAPRNFVQFNPHGRFICIAGFGNLSGTMDIWDRKKLKKVTSIEASGSTYCDWSPDGRYILTSTLSPRLRVDNGLKLWHYSGTLVYESKINELYQTAWKPSPSEFWPEKSAQSPPPKAFITDQPSKPPVKSAGAYRPPQARTAQSSNAPSSSQQPTQRYVPGAEGLKKPNKNRKNRNNKN